MKTVKKVFAFVICIIMLITSMVNDGWYSVIKPIVASAMAGHEQKYNDTRVELDFNKDWLFAFSDDDAASLKGFDDSDWESVDLPHDFSISQGFTTSGTEAESGNIPGGTGWYRKWFNLYEYYNGDRIFLNFDGAYQHTYVYVNGKYVGENHYGYNSFSFEISEYLINSNTAHNLIAVKVVNDLPSSRWYSGSGIYRDVTLTVAGPVHVALYGPRLTTPDIKNGGGKVEAKIKLHNDTAISKKVTVEATILDENHNPVSETVVSSLTTVVANTETEITLSPGVAAPELWTLDNPTLYKLKTVVKNENGELIDEYHTTFGYRYISWDRTGGFMLNGEYTKLKGVCLHHDQGALGAAQEYDAIYRQLVTLKDMGCNAIRTSHNSTSKILIDICNELGILVVEEFFDGWDASKNSNDNDFSKFFFENIDESNTAIGAKGQKWYQYVVEHAILRDEHDPCIIAWDVGNELCNISYGESTENYETIVKSIVNITDTLDPSRVVLQGDNAPNVAENAMVDSYMDVIGGNYNPYNWVTIMNDPSDPRSTKPFVATESASAITSRGVYYTMGIDEDNFQCTSYDTNAVSWGNTAATAWYYVVTNDWFSGEFVWTGFDYIGEPTPWNDDLVSPNPNAVPNSSYFGVVDTAGFEKDSYYLYRSLWNEDSTTLHLVPGSWNKDSLLLNNGYVNVAVYSNAKKVELLLNGEVIATAVSQDVASDGGLYTYKTWTESINNYSKCSVGSFYTAEGADLYPQFSVKYEEGTLSVKAYDENNNEITDTVGSTKSVTGSATQIIASVWQDKYTYVADGNDYIYIEFEARDADGNFMNDYNGTLNVLIGDAYSRYAKIVGVDNGNPATTEKFQQSSVLLSDSQAKIQMFNGRALVILKTTEEEGAAIVITAETADFEDAGHITIESVGEEGIKLTDEFDEVIRQNENEYAVTLYDEYEVVKYHINKLEKPEGGSSGGNSGSDDSGETVVSDKYEIYLADSTVSEGCVEDGDYVIYNQWQANQHHVIKYEPYGDWGIYAEHYITDTEASADGSPYAYEKLKTDSANEFTFTHIGNNLYYIQNKSNGKYLKISGYTMVYSETPEALSVDAKEDGSILIHNYDYYALHEWDYFYASNIENASTDLRSIMWLYSAPGQSAPSEPSEPSVPSVPTIGDYYGLYTPGSDANMPIEDGDYLIAIDDVIMPELIMNDTVVWGSGFEKESISADSIAAPAGAPYKYEGIKASEANEYSFISQGNGNYYIRHKQTGYYLYIINGTLWAYETSPQSFSVTVNDDGSLSIAYASMWSGTTYIGFNPNNTGYISAVTTFSDTCKIRLYSDEVPVSGGGSGESGGNESSGGSNEKLALYNALYDGIEEDYSIYTRASFENLLRKLEDGVAVFSDENSSSADYVAATEAIYAAIAALEMDIKKIDGTLFKYGYSNINGSQDYSSGGVLMNDVALRQMKTAILADVNLVNQIKEIIGYDDSSFGWTGNRADEVLEEVAEAYAMLYTLQFTGKSYASSPNYNAGSNYPQLEAHTAPPVTLWNLWTKDNTHGANDPIINGSPLHDGASVQGLAGATLEKGVITSHAAYTAPLSYANDGPSAEHDITNYTYGFDTGSGWKTVTLEYLSGISVYFPDLFSRESLDVNGNVTTATTGEFAKYYWDAEFPIFISTDAYGINTYHFDSKDTKYLVQSSFNDSEHKVEMELNEVGQWNANGSNSGSGFFPFNYQQGATTYTGEDAIYHYGFTFEHNFYIPKGGKHANGEDVIFNFSGDDDVYVYIDGVLVLDNGGLHGAREVTVNFTNCTINYQYAMDVTDGQLKGDEYEFTYSYNKMVENDPEAATYNADTVAALNKLHEIISDGQVHTLNFFYLERGSSDSNCRMAFNLSETSEEVKIIDQTLTLDYGLPVEYDITENNNLSQAAIDSNVKVEYLGICAVNEEVETTYTFELPEIIVPFESGVTYKVEGMKYGDCTIDADGNTSYTPHSMNMSESEHFYVCAKITGDPTYADDVVYYQIEKTTFVPSSTIYYEDTYETITYTDGKVPQAYNNSVNEYGLWKTDGMQDTTLKQNADLTDSMSNSYGYESNYMSFAEYSGGSSHYVDVSTKNNPNSKYSGGSGAAWPTVDFTFTGTGFDLISVTDCTTGAFSVMVKNANGKIVKSTVVDTFYGYNYGRIYMNADGKPTLDSSLTPMYRSEDGTCTSDERYYDVNGAITDVKHYYDADGNVTETQTEEIAYAYAYGWVLAEDGTTDTLYQIPVIKITDLEYGSYSVTITPTFTSIFGHSSTAEDGTSYYRVYLDAIRIYSPAGMGDDIKDKVVKDSYATDDELYPYYLELKNMLVGADCLSETDNQGIIFIDGIAALDNNIKMYKDAGPNNELYLAKDQAVAFEIWATAVPTDVQIGAKLACGKPAFTISYASKTTDIEIGTATDIYYSFNSVLPNDGKLTWKQITAADGNNYYTTGTVVIQNTGEEGSVLSVTNMKWTFSRYGGHGYFRIPTPVENDVVTVAATEETPMIAYSLMRMRTAALDVEQTQEPEVVTDADGNSIVTIKLNTSSDVDSVVVTDENGNLIPPEQIEYVASQIEGEDVIEWTVKIATIESGTCTYVVSGAYANGYTDSSKSVTVVVTIDNPPVDVQPDNDTDGENGESDDKNSLEEFFERITGIYNKLIEFFRAIFALFGVSMA